MKLSGKQFLWIVIALILVIAAFWYFMKINAKPAHAFSDVCDQGEHIGNPHCITPTPTKKPSPTPSPTVTPSPIPFHFTCNEDHSCVKVNGKGESTCEENEDCKPHATPTPIPYHFGCNEDHACVKIQGKGVSTCETSWQCKPHDCDGDDCVTPTPTAIPSATPTPEQGSSSGGGSAPTFFDGSYHVQTCNGIFPDKPLLQGFKALGNGSVEFSWWGVNADKYSMRYGYDVNNLIYGIPYIPNTSTSITISGLQEGRNVWAVLTAYKGECAIGSNPLDPIVK